MDYIIKKLENKPFSGDDILTICSNKTKIIRNSEIHKFRTLDQLLKPYGCVVLLYETRPSYGHWVCIIKHGGKKPYIEFFDSYGMKPDHQLGYIDSDFKKMSYQDYPHLTKLLYESKYPIVYNSTQIQKYIKDISTCGRHIAFRICMRHLPLNKYISLIKSSSLNPDKLVTYLTAFQ